MIGVPVKHGSAQSALVFGAGGRLECIGLGSTCLLADTKADKETGVIIAPMPKSSRDVIIRTESLAEAERFYGEVLGFAAASRVGDIVGFETGSFCLYIEKGATHGPVFEFLVADVEAMKISLIAAGCTLIEEDRSIPRCYVQDPYGVTFNIGRSDTQDG